MICLYEEVIFYKKTRLQELQQGRVQQEDREEQKKINNNNEITLERLSKLNINLNLFPSAAVVKNPSGNAGHAGDSVSIPGPERAPGIGGKSPLSRKWQPTLVFLLGKPHEQRSLVGYIQSTGSQKVGQD